MRHSRHFVLAVLVGLLVVSAGCIGVLTGSEPAVFEASEAGASEQAVSQTDFEPREDQSQWLNRTVTVAGQERDVRVLNHVQTYEIPPSVDATGGVTFGMFVVASTPEASVAGQAMNPIGRMSHQEMIQQLAADSANLRDIERESTKELTVLGESAEVVRFSAIAEQSGQEVPVYVEVTRVQDDGDFVVGIGAYPQDSADVEPQVETMFESIQH